MKPAGSIISAIAPGSAAEAAGLQAGDRLLSLDGHPMRDIIDYRFFLEPGRQDVEISRNHEQIKLMLDAAPGSDPGIEFAAAIFDRIHTCKCRCLFCFVDQLPKGLRKSLYVKDDDYRLSFLYGNFITLNNLSGADIERILEQRLSPLYVSVHSTDPAVRGPLMGVAEQTAARGLDTLGRLGAAGIRFHAQIVLCPGINDRHVLADTVAALADKYQGVESVGIVPVAVSPDHLMHHAGLSDPVEAGPPPLRPVTAADCKEVIGQVRAWQERYRGQGRTGFVYAADEFYLRGGMVLPPTEDYDDFAQFENGIGVAASFMEEAADTIRRALAETKTKGHDPHISISTHIYLLTGTLAAHMVGEICRQLHGPLEIDIRPLVVENQTFGPHVSVTGLLGGKDIINAARSAGLTQADLLLLPGDCLDSTEHPRFLDNVTLEEMRQSLPCVIWTPRES